MRLRSLRAITLALSLSGAAAAQVGTLVRHDTANDPCQRFRMRVLMPADVSPKPRSKSPAGSPDPGIVWDPCREGVIQLASAPVMVMPEEGPLPAVPPFELQPFTLQSPPPRGKQPTVLGVQLPPAFEMMRRHQ